MRHFFLLLCLVSSALCVYKLENVRLVNKHYLGDVTYVSGPEVNPVKFLALDVNVEHDNIVRMRITDKTQPRWEVKDVVQEPYGRIGSTKLGQEYSVTFSENPFGLVITHKSGVKVFDSTACTFAYENQHLVMCTAISNSDDVFGLGERLSNLRVERPSKIVLWNRDQHGTPKDTNLYGSIPFHMVNHKDSTGQYAFSSGLFVLNSNAMSYTFDTEKVQIDTIGGIWDVFVMTAPSPVELLKTYHSLIGSPAMPPRWALGWHQSKWGWPLVSEVKTSADRYTTHKIPLDVMWADIQYMEEFRTFSNSELRYSRNHTRKLLDELHNAGRKFVYILDPCVFPGKNFAPYQRALSDNVLVMTGDGKSPAKGAMWPAECVWIDFTAPNSTRYWSNEIKKQFDTWVPADGLWVDMNDPSLFLHIGTKPKCETDPHAFDADCPKFNPTSSDLHASTLYMNSRHHDTIHYNLHNLYGLHETKATADALLSYYPGKRPFVLSRSTSPSSGKYGAHWTGDNASTWEDLALSIPGMLAMNMFGIPLVGADICGFMKSTEEELCTRWQELGSFYGFARNHNNVGTKDQQPWCFSDSHLNITRDYINQRYTLLSALYTEFHFASVSGGGVMWPTAFLYPNEPAAVAAEYQFFWGDYLLIAPVVTQGATSVSVYLPKADTWFAYPTGVRSNTTGQVTVSAPRHVMPMYLRGGVVLPTQAPAMNTRDLERSPYTLIVTCSNRPDVASGRLYLDDGESIKPQTYQLIEWHARKDGNSLVVTNNSKTRAAAAPLAHINLWGVSEVLTSVKAVSVNGKMLSSWSFDRSTDQLKLDLTSCGLTIADPLEVMCQ